ncbi:hypothetical protein GCM10009675_51730 [Prauserella alba]|uniref:Uncharacterized protein n=1 Tax=Prauserella alba TaxID=176898 RepID=A0ABP4GEB6_9PSEU
MTLRRKYTGAKRITEAADCTVGTMVGERSKRSEVRSEERVERLEVRMPV